MTKPAPGLAPSEIRKLILEDHQQLRESLAHVKTAIDSGRHDQVRELLRALMKQFLRHIEREESILRPILKDIDAWGPVRVDRMNKEHAAQRAELTRLETLVKEKSPRDYLKDVEAFITELHGDMEAEEKDCLSAEVLRDDTITVGIFGG